MPDLAAELLRRNARLRAWREYGVPVEGGWKEVGSRSLVARLWLNVNCGACGAYYWERLMECSGGWRHEGPGRANPCPHLAPLLGEDPPEVEQLTALELLAGP